MAGFAEVLRALVDADVTFVVVGGVAVVLQGHPRLTADLDVVLDLERGMAAPAIAVLEGLGYEPQLPVPASAFADDATRRSWVEERNLLAFTMVGPDGVDQVDLFAVAPVPFDELLASASSFDVDGRIVRVASIEHLIAMKDGTGRPKDEADVAELRAIAALRDQP